jgi:uncharacterized repeat protein (TIGR03803 family)
MKYKMTLLSVVALVSWSVQPLLYAQSNTFNVLYNFSSYYPGTNSDGVNPIGQLGLSSNTLYGTALRGGSSGNGTVFRVSTDGSDFTNLYSFNANSNPAYTNSDGNEPTGSVVSGNTLYGTAETGGTGGSGAVFRINIDGSGFTNLHSFAPSTNEFELTNADGIQPFGGVIISSNVLYGTTEYGGVWGSGTVFRVNTDGSVFTNLYSFSPYTNHNSQGISTNSDGAVPGTGVVLSSNTLYGTTSEGGTGGYGGVFRLNVDGSGFTNLHSFTNASDVQGGGPMVPLVMSGNTLFGGGPDESGNFGAIFWLNTDGSDFAYLYTFTGGADGTDPTFLTLSGNVLYGGASGNLHGGSTLFRLNTNGGGFTTLFNFPPGYPGNPDGAVPAGIVLSGNTLYGDTQGGGNTGSGVVYALTLAPPALGIVSAGNQVVISWPVWAASFGFQTTTNLASGNWSGITNGIVTDGTNYYFTYNVTGQTAFFHLLQQ